MARYWLALLLLAAVANANAGVGTEECHSWQWQCEDGQCIWASDPCTGVPQCKDKSDEKASMCDKVPSIRMQLGHVRTVRVEYTPKQEFTFIKRSTRVEFHLCGRTFCSVLFLEGRTPDGALEYSGRTECNLRGRSNGLFEEGCTRVTGARPEGSEEFSDGPMVFKVERRPGELAVWLDGHEDKAATVPVKEDCDLLRVRSTDWASRLRVQFNELSCANEKKLSRGVCISPAL